jgi:hypothetical protein
VDNQDIPVLTDVYQNQAVVSTPVNELVSSVDIALIRQQLTAEIKVELTQELMAKLQAEIVPDLHKELMDTVQIEFAQQLKQAQAEYAQQLEQVQAQHAQQLKKVQAIPVDTQAAEQDLIKKNELLLASTKKSLVETLEKLSHDSTEHMNTAIASKVTGMQDLAVSQAKAQIAKALNEAQQTFTQSLAAQEAQFHEKAKQVLASGQQVMVEQMQASALAKLNPVIDAAVASKKAQFKQAFDVEIPGVEKMLNDKFNQLLNAELPVFEQTLMLKVKARVIETLQSVKLVFPK